MSQPQDRAGRGALSGIRVVDLATERAELCGRVLADLGAEVVKVEPPEGARARRVPPYDDEGRSLYWSAVALGKRSVVLDIEEAHDRTALLRLLASADVLIESFTPGYLASLGLDFGELQRDFPGLIYVSVTPFGQVGPLAGAPASELTLEAAGGLLALQGDGDRPPIPVGYPQAAFHAGVQAAADSIIALVERDRSGEGQHLDVSMQAAMVWTLMNATGFPSATGSDPPGAGDDRAAAPPTIFPGVDVPRLMEVADGFAYVGLGPARLAAATFDGFMRWVEAEGECPTELHAIDWHDWGVAVDEGRLTRAQVTSAIAVLRKFIARHTKQELFERSLADGMMLAPVYNVSELASDRQLTERGYWWTVDGLTHPGPFAKLSATPLRPVGPAPALDADQSLLDTTEVRTPPVRGPKRRSQPFEGLRVADFSWVGVGPIVAKALADHGATVVRVESSQRIDVLRERAPYRDGVPGVDRSQFMANFNSSKLGMAINLQAPEGRYVARRLADWADVIVESFTPGTMARFGLDFATISAERPGLIMFSTSLRGDTGPQRSYGGFGTQGASLAGLHGLTGWPDRPPTGPWGAYTDMIAPRYGVAALAAAIHHRAETGRGQHIDLSQVEAAIHFIEPLVLEHHATGREATAPGTRSPRAAPHGVYAVAGVERYVAISADNDAQWVALRDELLSPQFADPKWSDPKYRIGHADALDYAIAHAVEDRDGLAVVQQLRALGVPAAVVSRPSDLYRDAQLAARDFFVTLEHSVMGPTAYDGPATIFSATPAKLSKAAPCLGEDTFEVLTELLELSADEVAGYAAAGVLS